LLLRSTLWPPKMLLEKQLGFMLSGSNTTAARASQASVEITVALDFSLPASVALVKVAKQDRLQQVEKPRKQRKRALVAVCAFSFLIT
jgi:hypothetical protein